MEPVALVADHPRLALGLIVAGWALPPLTSAVVFGLHKSGKDKTWWGAAICHLSVNLGAAARSIRERSAPYNQQPLTSAGMYRAMRDVYAEKLSDADSGAVRDGRVRRSPPPGAE